MQGLATIWDFVTEGLFAVFLVGLLSVIQGVSNSFGVLLYGMFGKEVDSELATVTANWSNDLKSVLEVSAGTIKKVASAQGLAYTFTNHIILFALFIGALFGIVVYALTTLRVAKLSTVPIAGQ